MAYNGSALEKFESKYLPEPNTGCWLWMDGLSRKGYGQFYPIRGVQVRAHRFSYEAYKGEIPEDLQIDHLCRQRCCVNPDHLEAVTPAENTRRGRSAEVNKIRFARMSPEEKAKAIKGLALGGPANGAKNKAKTHCPYGHPYSGDNLRKNGPKGRGCKKCHALREARRRKLKKQKDTNYVRI